jgi:hypothetical protein
MKIPLKYTIIGIFVLYSMNINAQFWSFNAMNRFGKTVYYPIDSLNITNLRSKKITSYKEITNRYFEIVPKNDSIKFLIDDSLVYFRQKQQKEPICYKQTRFFIINPLFNSNTKIKYFKLIDIDEKHLIAKPKLKQKKRNGISRQIESISIEREDVKGVYLGYGQKARAIATGIEISVVILLLLTALY